METGSIIKVTHPPGTEPRYYQAGSIPGLIGWKMALDGMEPGYAATVRWVEEFWPLYCPMCGRAVHQQLSAHHEMYDE